MFFEFNPDFMIISESNTLFVLEKELIRLLKLKFIFFNSTPAKNTSVCFKSSICILLNLSCRYSSFYSSFIFYRIAVPFSRLIIYFPLHYLAIYSGFSSHKYFKFECIILNPFVNYVSSLSRPNVKRWVYQNKRVRFFKRDDLKLTHIFFNLFILRVFYV